MLIGKTKKERKKKPCFGGGRTFQVESLFGHFSIQT